MRYKPIFPLLLTGLLALGLLGFFGPLSTVNKGNKLFTDGKYDQALARYTDAQLEDPDNPRLHFNIGDVLYRQKKYDLAVESFVKVTSTTEEEELAQKAWYNLGNCYFRQAASAGDIELLAKSVDAYTQALKIDPTDEDAKYNLEVARKMLELKKEEEKSRESSCPRKKKSENGSDQQKKKDGEQEERTDTDESETSTKEASIEPMESPPGTPEMQPQPADPREMTREEAERLLKALEEREHQNARERQAARPGGGRPFAGKDW